MASSHTPLHIVLTHDRTGAACYIYRGLKMVTVGTGLYGRDGALTRDGATRLAIRNARRRLREQRAGRQAR